MLLRKGVCPYECMDSCEKFYETSLPTKQDFCSELNLEGISNEDYAHAQKVWEVFEINNRDEYHDLSSFRNMCLDIYRLPANFVSAPGLA